MFDCMAQTLVDVGYHFMDRSSNVRDTPAGYLGRHSVIRGREHGPNQRLDLSHVALHRLETRQEQLAEPSESGTGDGTESVRKRGVEMPAWEYRFRGPEMKLWT